MIEVWTDGSCRSGEGGWAAVIVKDKELHDITAGSANYRTTNNQMELAGVIGGLRTLDEGATCMVFSDSAYVVNAFNKGWLDRWIQRGWRKTGGGAVANQKFWKRLLVEVNRLNVRFEHVRGHTGLEYNELADDIAGWFAYRQSDNTSIHIMADGNKITQNQVKRLWIIARENGYCEEGVRAVLAEYGLESSKSVTTPVYEEIVDKLSSRALSRIYNDQYTAPLF